MIRKLKKEFYHNMTNEIYILYDYIYSWVKITD